MAKKTKKTKGVTPTFVVNKESDVKESDVKESDVKIAATPDLSEENSDTVDVPEDVPNESKEIIDESDDKNTATATVEVVEDEPMETDDNVNKCDNETTNLNIDKENIATDNVEAVENTKETSTEVCNLNESVTIITENASKDDLIEIATDDSQLNMTSSSSVSINEIEEIDCVSQKKRNINEATVEDGEEWTVESRLESFMEWMETRGVTISPKVTIKCEGTSHRYGMIATDDIKKGELLCTVPRTVTLHPDNSRIVSEIVDYEDWLDSIGQSLDDSSGWATLLITLMLEFNDSNSFWAPYLRLVPQPEEFGHPLFWSSEEYKDELKGTTLLYDVQRDIYNIESEYKQFILPFIYRYKDICGRVERYDIALYKRLVAFVMSYSFTEDFDSQPAMVPVADMLNHSVNNNAQLLFGEENLKVIALKKVKKGEELFNTFGKLGNAELLQMYGYADKPPNIFDTLPILVNTFLDAMENAEKVSDSFFQAKVALLNKTEIAPSDDFFLFDRNGMRKGPDLLQMLKILFMPESEFEELLKSRCGNRPDSFYKKLLRKLKLAKRTDTSSGIAIIDITEEDEQEPPPKRKLVVQHEMDDDDDDDDEPPSKRHSADIQDMYLQLAHGNSEGTPSLSYLKETPQPATSNGNSISNAIVIDESDDDSDDDDGGGDNKTVKDLGQTDAINLDAIDGETKKTVEGNPKQIGTNNSDPTGVEVDKVDKNTNKDATITNLDPVKEPINSDIKDQENSSSKSEEEKTDDAEDAEDENTKLPVNGLSPTSNDKNSENNEILETDELNAEPSDQDKPNDIKTIEENSNTSNLEVNETEEEEDTVVCEEDNACKKGSSTTEKEENIENTQVTDNKSNTQANSSAETEQQKDSTNACIEVSQEERDDVVSIGDDIEDDLNKDEVVHESDVDDIEFVSEDIRCKITYERLANELKPEWKKFIISTLKTQMESLKQDEEMTIAEAQEQMSDRQFYSYQVRQGQRTIMQTFLSTLTT